MTLTPLLLLGWVLAVAVSIVILGFAVALAILAINTARHPNKKAETE
jgi:mannose/fructose/N-acetylgalactosamine-specific phosphotransferase system component IIC